MAKFLFSFFSNINWLGNSEIDPFYEGFIKTLIKHGNEVMLLRTNEFLPHQQKNCLFNFVDPDRLIQKVLAFNPDLIIAANNHVPEIILEAVDCPIILWTADNPTWYSELEYIKKNVQKYKFFHHGWDNIHVKVCMEMFNARREQNFCVGHATAVRAKDLPTNSNITFIGTVGHAHNMMNFLKFNCNNEKLKLLKNLYHRISEFPLGNLEIPFSNLNLYDFQQTITANNRIKTLDILSDLDLKIYGLPINFFEIVHYSMNLAFCFDYKPVISVKDTEDVLNSSKIGINLHTAHAVSSFSWRVADIMASNACLVSPNQPDLVKFNPYIKMPTFNSPQESREICQKLLKDDIWRNDVVAASHKAIEEHGRFEHKFKIIEEIFNVKLFKNTNKEPEENLTILRVCDYIKVPYIPLCYVEKKITTSSVIKKIIRGLVKIMLKIVPRPILSKLYHFILSIK